MHECVNDKTKTIIIKIMKTKTIITLILAFLFAAILQAQQNDEEMKLLFHKKDKPANEKIANGGYGALTLGWTQVEGKSAMLIGARAAWIANHHFALGFAGNGFFNDFYNGGDNNPEDYILAGGYGGILIEPIFFPMAPIHFSIPIIFGAGGVTAAPSGGWDNYNDPYYYNNYYYSSDAFFVVQPGIEAEFNIVKFFRIAVGASYRLTSGINLDYKYFDEDGNEQTAPPIDKNALNGFNANITFKFGWF